MNRHLSAFAMSFQVAAPKLISAVPDQANTTNGVNVQVPVGMNNIGMAAAYNGQTTFTDAQLQSPSLRQLANIDISPLNTAIVNAATPLTDDMYDSPAALAAGEYLNLSLNGTSAGAAEVYGIVDFVDGPVKPVTGKIFTIQATAAITGAVGTWVNGALTLDQVLPAGTYQLVGARVEAANAIAARFVFLGQGNRPGVITRPSAVAEDIARQRNGRLGVFGTFTNQTPPTMDLLSTSGDTAETVYLDLIKTA